jgi:tetratricopeptide (TPR) repeat protein
MGARTGRIALSALACLLWLGGCETSTRLGDLLQRRGDAAPKADAAVDGDTTQSIPAPGTAPAAGTAAAGADPVTTGSVRPPPYYDAPLRPDAVPKGLLGKDPNDDLSLGKKYFRAADFGLAERHFRRAVEQHPRDLEAWIGLAASYDRLRRWDLADRAYDQALKIAGPTPEILNNQGYSYMLRGDYRRAREILMQAHAQDPGNPYVKNNLELLEASLRKGKGLQ